MGVNYSHYLIPRDNTVRPDPDRIVGMIEAWIEKGFIVRPQSASEQDQPQSTSRVLETGARFTRGRETLDRQPAPEPRGGFWTRLWGGGAQRVPRPDPWMPFSIPPTGESLSVLAEPYALSAGREIRGRPIRWRQLPNRSPMATSGFLTASSTSIRRCHFIDLIRTVSSWRLRPGSPTLSWRHAPRRWAPS